MQRTFNPADFEFQWTDDGWYEWDHAEAHKMALRERNAAARTLRKEGRRVRSFSNPGQRISRGGIGSGHPHIELIVNVYGFDAN